MRITIDGTKYEMRLQTRTVVECDIMLHGELVASGRAKLNPVDNYDKEDGERIAIARALGNVPRIDIMSGFKAMQELVPKLKKRWYDYSVSRNFYNDFKKKAMFALGYGMSVNRVNDLLQEEVEYKCAVGTGWTDGLYSTLPEEPEPIVAQGDGAAVPYQDYVNGRGVGTGRFPTHPEIQANPVSSTTRDRIAEILKTAKPKSNLLMRMLKFPTRDI